MTPSTPKTLPDEQQKTERAMAALDTMATTWAMSFNLREGVKAMISLPDGEDRLMAFIKHCYAEGLYEGRTSIDSQATERFFMDHGQWHDRQTGGHLFTQEQFDAATDDVWKALENVGIQRDGWLTVAEAIAAHCGPKAPALAAQPPAVAAIPEAGIGDLIVALNDWKATPITQGGAAALTRLEQVIVGLAAKIQGSQPSAGQQDSYNRLEIDKLVYAITGCEQAEDAIADLKNAASCLDRRTIKQVLDLLEELGGQQDGHHVPDSTKMVQGGQQDRGEALGYVDADDAAQMKAHGRGCLVWADAANCEKPVSVYFGASATTGEATAAQGADCPEADLGWNISEAQRAAWHAARKSDPDSSAFLRDPPDAEKETPPASGGGSVGDSGSRNHQPVSVEGSILQQPTEKSSAAEKCWHDPAHPQGCYSIRCQLGNRCKLAAPSPAAPGNGEGDK